MHTKYISYVYLGLFHLHTLFHVKNKKKKIEKFHTQKNPQEVLYFLRRREDYTLYYWGGGRGHIRRIFILFCLVGTYIVYLVNHSVFLIQIVQVLCSVIS
uniref:Uncharacterized protein n=1 Tax=Cacopsylla melanoneura TaxID=428564 RepID=A0A8D9FGZ5_9HEMI